MRSLSRITLTYPLVFDFGGQSPTNPWWVTQRQGGFIHVAPNARGNDLMYVARQLGWARNAFDLGQEDWGEVPPFLPGDGNSVMDYRVNPPAVASSVITPNSEVLSNLTGWVARNILCTTNLRGWFNPICLPSYNSGESLCASVSPLRGATIRFHGWDFEAAPYWYACVLLYRLLMRRLSSTQRISIQRSTAAEAQRLSNSSGDTNNPAVGGGPVIFSRDGDSTLVMSINFAWSDSFNLNSRGIPHALVSFIDTLCDPSWVLFSPGDLNHLRELAIGILGRAVQESDSPLAMRYERALAEYVNI